MYVSEMRCSVTRVEIKNRRVKEIEICKVTFFFFLTKTQSLNEIWIIFGNLIHIR